MEDLRKFPMWPKMPKEDVTGEIDFKDPKNPKLIRRPPAPEAAPEPPGPGKDEPPPRDGKG